MPEVAGDAAILVDPLSVEEIAKAMQDVAGNVELKRSLIEKGRVRRDLFSWDRTATLLWNSLLQTLDNTK